MSRGSVLLLGLLAAPLAAAPSSLRVKASAAVAPCVAAAAGEYERAAGRRVAVETSAIGSPDSADGADVVVAADQELNRVIESGTSHPDLDVEVARIPWVLVGAPGTAAPELGSLGRSASVVRSLDGVVARETWRRLRLLGFAPARVERVRETPLRLQAGEAAVVPLSLAGPGPVTTLDVPPLSVHALGVRASPRSSAARAFLDFLSGEPGNAAFRACGRTKVR
ncbi:MAG TPA: substrate-binding domain-containing protein [Vicinamibacteria bacterium]|nr:substrate-binding domain-containing protein [Vicinamibacteria bacterium]